jgi:hypothetical protein
MYDFYETPPYNEIDYRVKFRPCVNIRKIYEGSISYNNRAHKYGSPVSPWKELNESDIRRNMVNQIRHRYTDYNANLIRYNISNTDPDIYHNYKNRVLDQIGEEYPFLKDACDDQKSKVVMVKKVKHNNLFFHKSSNTKKKYKHRKNNKRR